jgi:hypothetical protein
MTGRTGSSFGHDEGGRPWGETTGIDSVECRGLPSAPSRLHLEMRLGRSGRCGGGPAVVGGEAVQDALGNGAQLSSLGPRQSVEDELAHCVDM